MKGYIGLEDGTLFEGNWQGSVDSSAGEVVFNTSMVGYQEIVTDPSYHRQIIVMTAPEQGNYGVIGSERESEQVWVKGFVCVNLNESFSEGRDQFSGELANFSTPALSGVDTRSLTLHLRDQGTPWGAMVKADNPEEAKKLIQAKIQEGKKAAGDDWVYEVTTKNRIDLKGRKRKGRVAIIDYGVKKNIVSELQQRFKDVAIFGSRTPVSEILEWDPDGIMLTNGPGDPSQVKGSVECVQALLGQKPIFGICMGNQILALALGGKTYKLKFGHRGGNHPVQDFATNEIYMTSQNHGYAVSEDLPSGVKVSQINLYDKTVEGIEAPGKKAWSVQYHPESNPGPNDASKLFDYFASEVIK